MKTRYRLPDWLGGHDVEMVDDYNHSAVLVRVTETVADGGREFTIGRDLLEEVRPPSIDDPVALPLDIPMLQLKEQPRVTLRISPVGHDSAVDVAMLGNDGHEGYLEGRIWGDDLLHLAQAAWQAWQRANAIEAS